MAKHPNRDRRYRLAERWVWAAHRDLVGCRMLSVGSKQRGDVLEIRLMPQSVDEPAALVQWVDSHGVADGGPKWTPIRDGNVEDLPMSLRAGRRAERPRNRMSDYDTDIVEWSERQADALRRRASNEIDWENVAEEIEDVGNEQRNAVESLLIRIMEHKLQVRAWPTVQAVPHWEHEIAGWRVQLRRRLDRSPKLKAEMRGELQALYRDAIASMYREVDGVARPPLPEECPWTLDELLSEP